MYQGTEKSSKAIYEKFRRTLTVLKRCFFVTPMLFAPAAHALKFSDLTASWTTEFASGVSFALLFVAGLGVMTAGFSVISWIFAAKRQEPAKWQLYGVLGGAAAVIIPVIVLAFAGSLSNEQGGASGTFDDLDVRY